MQRFAIGLTLVMIALSGPVLGLAQARPAIADSPVLVIAPDAAAQVTLAGGHIIGPRVAPYAALAAGDPGFIAQLDQTDIWYARDGTWLAALCGVLS